MSTVAEIRQKIANSNASSAWRRGVRDYAEDLFDNYVREYNHLNEEDELTKPVTEADLLNGAESWKDYSWGGCSLIYNEDICKALCSPSEQKKYRYGERSYKKGEPWLDVQARVLRAAACLVMKIANREVA